MIAGGKIDGTGSQAVGRGGMGCKDEQGNVGIEKALRRSLMDGGMIGGDAT